MNDQKETVNTDNGVDGLDCENSHVSNGVYYCDVRMPLTLKMEAKEDMTAYELCKILPYLMGHAIYQDDYDAMGTEKRHLVIC